MKRTRFRIMAVLLCLAMLASFSILSGCKGSDGSTGATGATGGTGGTGPTGPTGGNVTNFADVVAALDPTDPSSKILTQMTGSVTSIVLTAATGTTYVYPVVNFTVKDNGGNGVTGLVVASASTPTNLNYVKVAIAYLSTDPTDSVTNAWTNYYVTGGGLTPANEGVLAGLADHGDGTYTYTFQSGITSTIDMTATHRVAIQISGTVPNSNPKIVISNPTNAIYDFVPNGAAVTNTRNIVSESACNKCHTKIGDTNLDPQTQSSFPTPGHGGRIATKYCVMCHNYQNEVAGLVASTATSTGLLVNPTSGSKHSTWMISNGTNTYNELEFVTLIHKTHMGSDLTLQNYSINADHYYPNNIGYPQDIRNCTTCHNNADGTAPDYGNWNTKPSMKACGTCHDNISWASSVPTGFVAHRTPAGLTALPQTDDSNCSSCHDQNNITQYHYSNFVTPNNPTGLASAASFSYVITSATVSSITASQGVAIVAFKIYKNGTAMSLASDFSGSTLNGFVGGPSLMMVYAMPQDGITQPSDWNSGHSSIALTDLVSGVAGTITGTTTMTAILSGASGTTAYYIPSNATMVTAAISGAFTQMNWASVVAPSTDLTYSVRPGIAAIKTATGYTARRTVFSESKCNTCHEQLGTIPNFHGGSYNIAMCAMCHTPNQSSNGWTASFRVWVHGIHASGKAGVTRRTVPFTWHAASTTENYTTLEYPGILNNCEQCHLAGTYDFSDKAYTTSVMSNMLNVLVAKGTYTTVGNTRSGTPNSYVNSPYIDATGNTNYGSGYSIAVAMDGTYSDGSGSNLVSSPITASCTACHDSTTAVAHMRENGGSFYATRAAANANTAAGVGESCLLCHGRGAVADIKAVHAY
jgi:OmcA/MtrC family decaheme c-type cytochrome